MLSRWAFGIVAVLAFGASAKAVTYNETFVLTGGAVVPPTSSTGFGAANVSVELDTATHLLSWNIIYTGLTGPVTAVQFHGPAPAGANASAQINVLGPFGNPIIGSQEISAGNVADITNGLWYLTLSTAANPNGEIRGQLPAFGATPVPEPAGLALLGMSAGALAWRRRR